MSRSKSLAVYVVALGSLWLVINACSTEVATFPGAGGTGATGVGASGAGGNTNKAVGELCSGASECASGYCPSSDGVCCDSGCSGLCLACTADKTGSADGTCAGVSADTDPDGECMAAACSGGVVTPAALCDGQGSCAPPATSTACDPYVCNATEAICLTSCGDDDDCMTGYHCNAANLCVEGVGTGEPCTDGAQCPSGQCIDDVCCDSSCGNSCDVCAASLGAVADGTCSPAPFASGGDPACSNDQVCDGVGVVCVDPCDASQNNKRSVGCNYFATFMDSWPANTNCFAAFVVNNWSTAAQISVAYQGTPLSVASFARIPSGTGASIIYGPYNAAAGLPAGEVAILFLSGNGCPVTSAVTSGVRMLDQTGIGDTFHITSDVPIAAYQMYPYGGGSAATTGASLLLPVDAWGVNYMLLTAQDEDIGIDPSLNIVASEDNTTVTLRPSAAVVGGGGVPTANANQVVTINLDEGEHAQITQTAQLSGSIIQSDKPVGVMAGHRCMRAPIGTGFCDHAEQMLPPLRGFGSEYAAVMHRPRSGEPGIWRLVGIVDGTTLTYSSDVGGPSSIAQGEIVDVITASPFVVSSQDAVHPFMLFNIMSGMAWSMLTDQTGHGDPDFVINVPAAQYLTGAYQFFTDPTYPETNLVIVRAKSGTQFLPVNLDCVGNLSGWNTLGSYEWTRVDLTTGDFQDVGNCSTGTHSITSDGPFGLWVWGWGTPNTTIFTRAVSYGYPGAMGVDNINGVIITP